jgi:hypothetical protein
METLALWLDSASLHKPIERRAAALQLARAQVWGFASDMQILAAIAFWPLEPGFDEVVLAGRPAGEIGPHMLRLARLAHLTFAERAQSGVIRFRALVRQNHRPGERLAQISGFRLQTSRDGWGSVPPGFTLWVREWENSSAECSDNSPGR